MQDIGIALLAITALALIWVWFRFKNLSPKPTEGRLVLIASFISSDTLGKDKKIHSKYSSQLREAIETAIDDLQLENIRVEVVHNRILPDDIQSAKALAEQHGAEVLVWGSQAGDHTHFSVMNLKGHRRDEATAHQSAASLISLGKEVDDNTFILTPTSVNHFTTAHYHQIREVLAFLILGYLYNLDESFSEGIQILAKAMALTYSNPPPMEGMGQVYFRLGWIYHVRLSNIPIALRYYNKAIEQDPAYVEAYNNRGVLRLFANDPVGALADLDQVLTLKPGALGALMSRGTLYHQLGKLDLAVADYSRFLVLAPDSVFNIAALYGRGSALAKQTKYDQALIDFEKALSLEPDNHIKAGTLYSMGSTLKEKALKSLLEQHPNQAEAHFTQALDAFGKALVLFTDPNEIGDTHYQIATIYQLQKNLPKALATMDKAIALYTDPKRLDEARYHRQVMAMQG